jgi:hypothetical protein
MVCCPEGKDAEKNKEKVLVKINEKIEEELMTS